LEGGRERFSSSPSSSRFGKEKRVTKPRFLLLLIYEVDERGKNCE